MRQFTLLLLRISVGFLVLVWGVDKIVNVDHGMAISERFYGGLFSSSMLISGWGIVQMMLGILMVVGLMRRWVYPAVALINGATLLVVWKSVIDPWGWYLEGTNALFFPSTTVFAASLVMVAFVADDLFSLDASFREAGLESLVPPDETG